MKQKLLFLFLSMLMSMSGTVYAQQTLEDVDGQSWADAVSPLDGSAPIMTGIPLGQVKHAPNDRQISLSGQWTLSDGQGVRVSAKIPGSIHAALMTRASGVTTPSPSNALTRGGLWNARSNTTVA